MADGTNAADLLDRLEKMEKILAENNQFDSSTLEKIAEARRLLGAGKQSEAEDAYTEIRILVERTEASRTAAPMAWMLFYLELAYLLVLFPLTYFTFKWPEYWSWSGNGVNLQQGSLYELSLQSGTAGAGFWSFII